MISFLLASIIFGLILCMIIWRSKSKFSHIPGIRKYPILGSLPSVDTEYFHVSLDEWAKKLGAVMYYTPPGPLEVIVNSYDAIREMLILRGKRAGGRPITPVGSYLVEGTGILFSTNPDNEWKSLRKASHKHLKQYGEGMTHLQNAIQDIQEDMFRCFRDNIGRRFDPKDAIFEAALNNIAFLLTGIKYKRGDPVIEMMRAYEALAPQFSLGITNPRYMMYNAFPWTRHLRLSTWNDIEQLKDLQENIYRKVQNLSKENPDTHNFFKILISHVADYDHSSVGVEHVEDSEIEYTENAVGKTLVALLLAGVTTTSTHFYAIINLLAHNSSIQKKLRDEIIGIGKGGPGVTINMDDRDNMPYCRAVIFEALRYVSALPVGVPHRAVEDLTINGLHIPANSNIVTNLFTLHHDQAIWEDPYVFKPERFLDDDGQLVPVDHPNRKHLLAFSAGPRVCLGESMALARLFIWTATLAQRYTIKPAPGNVPSLTDPRKFKFEGILRVSPFEVLINEAN